MPDRYQCWADGLTALPLPAAGNPVRILAGDFNSTLDHGRMRELLGAGYRDAADAMGDGLAVTWPANSLSLSVPGVTLDHVLVDPRVAVRAYEIHTIPDTDHRTVFAEVQLP